MKRFRKTSERQIKEERKELVGWKSSSVDISACLASASFSVWSPVKKKKRKKENTVVLTEKSILYLHIWDTI